MGANEIFKGKKGLARRKSSEIVEVRVSGMLKEHLAVSSEITGLTKAEILRRGLDLYFNRLRRDYDIPKNMTLEEYLASLDDLD